MNNGIKIIQIISNIMKYTHVEIINKNSHTNIFQKFQLLGQCEIFNFCRQGHNVEGKDIKVR